MKLITRVRVQLKTSHFKRLAGIAAGLGFLAAGGAIYANNGYDSSMLFLIGLLLIPLGVITIGSILVGKIDEETYS